MTDDPLREFTKPIVDALAARVVKQLREDETMEVDPERPTPDDYAQLAAIHATPDARACAALIRDYWRDGARADRTSRTWAYLHLGLLCGIIERLQES
jgi:hypothetical protein